MEQQKSSQQRLSPDEMKERARKWFYSFLWGLAIVALAILCGYGLLSHHHNMATQLPGNTWTMQAYVKNRPTIKTPTNLKVTSPQRATISVNGVEKSIPLNITKNKHLVLNPGDNDTDLKLINYTRNKDTFMTVALTVDGKSVSIPKKTRKMLTYTLTKE